MSPQTDSWIAGLFAVALVLAALCVAALAYTGAGSSPLEVGEGVVLDDQGALSLAAANPYTLLGNGDAGDAMVPHSVGLDPNGLLALSAEDGLGFAPIPAGTVVCNPESSQQKQPVALKPFRGLQMHGGGGGGGGVGLAPIAAQTMLGNDSETTSTFPQPVSVHGSLSLGQGGGLSLAPIAPGALLGNNSLTPGDGIPAAVQPLSPWALLTGRQGAPGASLPLDEMKVGPDDTALTSAGGGGGAGGQALAWLPVSTPLVQELPFTTVTTSSPGFWEGFVLTPANMSMRFTQLSVNTTLPLVPWKIWIDLLSLVPLTHRPTQVTGRLTLSIRPYVPTGYKMASFDQPVSVENLATGEGEGYTFSNSPLNGSRAKLLDVWATTSSNASHDFISMRVNATGIRQAYISFTLPMTIMLQKI